MTGMAEAGIDVRNADLIVGTSSCARVSLHLASGTDLEELFQRQVGPNPRPARTAPVADWVSPRSELVRAKEAGGGLNEILRRIGSLALATSAPENLNHRQIVAAQLPMPTWPEQELLIGAVSAETGERRAFDRSIVRPDENTVAAFASVGSMMSPAICEPAARAGRMQGRRLINERVCSVW